MKEEEVKKISETHVRSKTRVFEEISLKPGGIWKTK